MLGVASLTLRAETENCFSIKFILGGFWAGADGKQTFFSAFFAAGGQPAGRGAGREWLKKQLVQIPNISYQRTQR